LLFSCGKDETTKDAQEQCISELEASLEFNDYLSFARKNYQSGYPKTQIELASLLLSIDYDYLMKLEDATVLNSILRESKKQNRLNLDMKAPIFDKLRKLESENKLNEEHYSDFKAFADSIMLSNNIEKSMDDKLRQLNKETITTKNKELELRFKLFEKFPTLNQATIGKSIKNHF